MTRILLKLTIPLVLVFAGALTLVRAREYDDSDLRAIFSPTDCTAPCFLGIRPNVTRADDALTLLESHPWVESVNVIRSSVIQRLTWRWNGSQPAFLSSADPIADAGSLDVERGVVTAITVASQIRMGDVWLVYGKPDTGMSNLRYQLRLVAGGRSTDVALISQIVAYADAHFEVTTLSRCPLSGVYYWSTPVEIFWRMPTGVHHEYNLDSWLRNPPC